MIMEQERRDIVEYCNRLLSSGLTKGTGGNISIFNRQKQLMAISPSGIEYNTMRPEDVVVLDLENRIIDSQRKPSSELEMHSIFYRKRTDINAVVHTHSVFAKTLSALRWSLPAVSYLVAYAGKNVRCAEYASFGTKELAENAFKAMDNRKAVLLANHGLLTGAHDIKNALILRRKLNFAQKYTIVPNQSGTP